MTLPEFLTEETEDAILQRMLSKIPDDIDKSEGSYIYDALAAVAAELTQMKIDMGNYLNRGFASTTFGEYLDMRCYEHGITRRPAVKATGQVKFTGAEGTVIPAGTMVSTAADEVTGTQAVEFQTISEATIPAEGYVTVDIEAVEAGTSGNVAAGKITILVTPVNGVSSVTNEAPTTGGADTESDASLLARYLAKVQAPGTSGNKADYRNWALEVAGVGDAKVIPLWNGPGTVKVVLLDTDKQPASQAIVDAVQAYIDPDLGQGEGKAPIGAAVTVVAATAVNIDVSATVIHDGTRTIGDIQSDFENALVEYFKEIAFSEDPTVRYSHIGSLLLNVNGVVDYSNLLVNNGTANVPIAADEVAVKGTVSLSE